MLRQVALAARSVGIEDRLVAVHADLGRLEWEGVPELAVEQVGHYGPIPFEVVRNPNWRDLLDRIESHGKFPDGPNRFCTSEFKTGQVRKLMTALVALQRARWGLNPNGRNGRRVRILNCLGMRAQESPKRAAMEPFAFDKASSNTKRHVDEWLPIHGWTIDQVWADIRASGVRYHPAYDLGLPRLSCSFCVLASKPALIRAAQLRPALAAEYAAVEVRIGHRFKDKLSMAQIIEEAKTAEVAEIGDWAA